MAQTEKRAVMHCKKTELKKVVSLGQKVYNDGVYKNTGAYANPNPDDATFKGQVKDAVETVAAATGGGVDETALARKMVGILFDTMKNVSLPYVNGLYLNDEANLLLSGYDVNDVPVVHGIPDPVVIKRIVDGPLTHSAKIFIDKPANAKKQRLTYTVFMSYDDVEANYKPVLSVTNMTKLIVPNLTRGKEVWFYVIAGNAAGGSETVSGVKFLPR